MADLELPPDRLPLFVGAGVSKGPHTIRELAEIPELAVQVLGSFSEERNHYPGKHRVFYYDAEARSAWNAIRLSNIGRQAAGEYLPEHIDMLQAHGQLAIVGITSLPHEEPLDVLPNLAEWGLETGADGIEINGSCPNVAGQLLCRDLPHIKEVAQAVKERIGDNYLIVKMGRLGESSIRHYKAAGLAADAISTVNAQRGLSPVDPASGQRVIEVNDGYAGQSGPAISSLARNELHGWLRKIDGGTDFPTTNPDFDVWSVGGVEDGYEIYDRQRRVGAFAVGSAQAIYRELDRAALIKRWATEYAEAANLEQDLIAPDRT